MNLQLIRNATVILEYKGKRLLIDPMLGPKHQFRSFAGISENPTVDMPVDAQDVLINIDGVLVSHLHPDHFDEEAKRLIPKEMKLFCHPAIEDAIGQAGFDNLHPVTEQLDWGGIQITPAPAVHGYGQWAERMGPVSGYIFRAEGEPTIYWGGDTILSAEVEQALVESQPDFVITHSAGAQFGGPYGLIIMDIEQTLSVARLVPKAKIIATHMESLDHCTVSREALLQAAEKAGVADRFLIPADGELLENIE